jgi:FHS family glucose/mannose:H+ symporter-like MFS transporter
VSDNSKVFLGTLFAGFVVTGAATVFLAPMLPILAAQSHLSDESSGTLFTCQFLGSIIGTLLSGYLVRHGGFRRTLCAGYLCMSAFTSGILTTTWPWVAALVALNGLGLGLVIPATNMAVSNSFPQDRASALNIINLSWSVGAIACPTVLAFSVRIGVLGVTVGGLAVLLIVMAIAVLRTPESRNAEHEDSVPGQFPRTPFVILAVLFFLYVGSEGAIAGWLATYAKRTVMTSGVLWMTAPSFFWAAIMLGRAFSPVALRYLAEAHLLVIGLTVSAFGIAVVLTGSTSALVLSGAATTGLGMSSIFPIFIAMVSDYFCNISSRVSSYLFAMAGLGGAVLPWLVGVVSFHTGQLRAGLFVAMAGVLTQLILSSALVLLFPSKRTEPI